MVTLEEAEAESWSIDNFEHEYNERENAWSSWEKLYFVFKPKVSVDGTSVWGSNIYKRTNQNKRTEFANQKQMFQFRLKGEHNG